MKSITRYVLRQLGSVLIFVTVGLTAAIWLTQSLRFVDLIVNRGLPLSTFVYLTVLLLPTFLTVILPIGLFCAILFTYHRMTMDSELVVMRSLGMSQWSLARPAMYLSVIVVGFGYLLSMYLLPTSYRQFKELEHTIRSDYASVLLQAGKFNTPTKTLTIYVRERAAAGELLGVLVHDTRDAERPVTYMAENGKLISTADGPRVVLENGNRQEVNRDTGELSLLYFDRYTVDMGKLQTKIDYRWREPRERYLHELLWPDNSPGDQAYFDNLIAEGHQRIVGPLYALTFALIGLAALLSGDFNRRGQTRRVLSAVMLVLLTQVGGMAFQNLVAKEPMLLPLIYANGIVPIVFAAWILVYKRRPPRSTPTRLALNS